MCRTKGKNTIRLSRGPSRGTLPKEKHNRGPYNGPDTASAKIEKIQNLAGLKASRQAADSVEVVQEGQPIE